MDVFSSPLVVAAMINAATVFVPLVFLYIQNRGIKKTIDIVHVATNSLTDRLVASTAKESFSAGQRAGGTAPRKKLK